MDIPNTVYRIDEKDQISFVNGQWTEFATSNDAPELVGSSVLSRDFWEFITDDATLFFYRQLVKRVREGHRVQFEFRCDSPDLRRDVEMRMSLCPGGEVEFDVRVLSVEPRDTFEVLSRHATRSDDLIYVCSWCNRIKLDNVTWAEIEEAIGKLGTFEGESLPKLSHGICEDCYTKVTGILATSS